MQIRRHAMRRILESRTRNIAEFKFFNEILAIALQLFARQNEFLYYPLGTFRIKLNDLFDFTTYQDNQP